MGELDTLAKRIRYLTNYMNFTQKKLGEEMGKSEGFISHITHDHNRNPGDAFYIYFKERFNVNPEWLAEGVGVPFLDGGPQDNFNLGKVVGLLNCLSDELYNAAMVILRELANHKFLKQIQESSNEK